MAAERARRLNVSFRGAVAIGQTPKPTPRNKRCPLSFVMHGLAPCNQGRHGMTINKGAAWMPGSGPE